MQVVEAPFGPDIHLEVIASLVSAVFDKAPRMTIMPSHRIVLTADAVVVDAVELLYDYPRVSAVCWACPPDPRP